MGNISMPLELQAICSCHAEKTALATSRAVLDVCERRKEDTGWHGLIRGNPPQADRIPTSA